MKVITKRDLIKTVAKRWYDVYFNYGQRNGWPILSSGKSSQDIYYKLSKLNTETATSQEVANIIGNHYWTDILCNECLHNVDKAIIIEHSNDVLYICEDCLSKLFEEFT